MHRGQQPPMPYQLPKTMRVGELFQTAEGRKNKRAFDMRVLAIIHINDLGESVRVEEVSTNQHDVVNGRERVVIVWETYDPMVAPQFAWKPRAELRYEFIQAMSNELPILYTEPDVEALIKSAVRGAGHGFTDQPTIVFLTSEAYQIAYTRAKHKPNGFKIGNLPTLIEYDGVRLVEVPGIEGIEVWGGHKA